MKGHVHMFTRGLTPLTLHWICHGHLNMYWICHGDILWTVLYSPLQRQGSWVHSWPPHGTAMRGLGTHCGHAGFHSRIFKNMLWVLGWGGGGESRGKMYTDICIFMPDMLYNVSSLSLGEKSGQNLSTCIFKPDNLHLISSKLKSVLVSNVKIVNVIGLNHNLLLIVCRYIILYVYCHRHYHHYHHHCRKDKVHSSLVHVASFIILGTN